MVTLFSLLIGFLLYQLDTTRHKIFFIICFLFIFCLGLAYDTSDSLFNQKEVFMYHKPKLEWSFFLVYIETLIAFLIFYCVLLTNKVQPLLVEDVKYDVVKLKRVYYLFAFASIAAFAVNLYRVISTVTLRAIVLAPRVYEEVFGHSTAINYIYFLNIPALCLSVYLKNNGHVVKRQRLLNVLLVSISFFHGIKFTIYDTLLIPAIFLFLNKKEAKFKPVFLFGSSLLAIYFLFGFFIRGGVGGYSPVDQLLSYITPNFYNFFYSIEKSPEQFTFFATLVTPDKLPDYFISYSTQGASGFLLNNKYNMQTILSAFYSTFSIFAPFLFLPYLLLTLFLYKNIKRNLVYYFLTVYFIYSLLFSFYVYAFTKTKYIYLVFIVLIVHFYARQKTHRRKV